MQFLLIIYQSEAEWTRLQPSEREVIYQEYRDVIQKLANAGKFLGGNELKLTPTARTVRVRHKKKIVTDGPFAETKEQLGGYFLVEVKNLDEAIEIAAQIPSARDGSVEVREVMPSK